MKLFSLSAALILCIAATGCDRQKTASSPVSEITAAAEPRYEATYAQGIDLKRTGLPIFVKKVEGLSGQEDWGRWSDSNVATSVKIYFVNPLPQKFTLELIGRGLAENTKLPTSVLIGGIKQSFIAGEKEQTYKLSFNLTGPASEVEITPPSPMSPKELGFGDDSRRLGFGLTALKILTN